MKIAGRFAREDLATVYIAEIRDGLFIEFVESVEPPNPPTQKWVSIVSTLFGCPSQCLFCDAGLHFSGKLTAEEIIGQIDYLVTSRYPDRKIPSAKWKIQFARMGDPAFNPAVLDVLEQLPSLYDAPGIMPSISTIAPVGTESYFERLTELKLRLYPLNFQFQFSIHSTDQTIRRRLIPLKTWNFTQMSQYGRDFYTDGGRKLALNFALIEGVPIDADVLAGEFDPTQFIIKITPLNPTQQVVTNGLVPADIHSISANLLIDQLRQRGFEVIVSIGELAENEIGSNCGQYVSALNRIEGELIRDLSSFPIQAAAMKFN